MCEKRLLIYTCGCTQTQDPHACAWATSRNKISCDGYAFIWAYRAAIPTHQQSKCRSCMSKDECASSKHANAEDVATWGAYPSLKATAECDDTLRVRAGRAIYDRSGALSSAAAAAREEEEIVIPAAWTAEMNRLPGNANEYSAFLAGKFDPLVRLPDTHEEEHQQQQGIAVVERDDGLPHVMPRQGLHRLRSHAPPLNWREIGAGAPVLLEETEYPYVEFRGNVAAASLSKTRPPGSSRRSSYTASKQEKGWTPLTGGILPPQSDEGIEPPSKTPSPQQMKKGSLRK